MELKNSKTYTNLARSFVGESCARNRYTMLAKLAKKEGYSAMCDLINVVAENEFHHSRMMFSFIDSADINTIDNIEIRAGFPFKEKLHSLVENLKLAEEDELIEANKIYPEFSRIAKEEGFEDIANFYANLVQIETCHAKLFNQLYTQLKDGTLYNKPQAVKWKCSECGHEDTLKQAWINCPVCQAPQGDVMIHIEDGN